MKKLLRSLLIMDVQSRRWWSFFDRLRHQLGTVQNKRSIIQLIMVSLRTWTIWKGTFYKELRVSQAPESIHFPKWREDDINPVVLSLLITSSMLQSITFERARKILKLFSLSIPQAVQAGSQCLKFRWIKHWIQWVTVLTLGSLLPQHLEHNNPCDYSQCYFVWAKGFICVPFEPANSSLDYRWHVYKM